MSKALRTDLELLRSFPTDYIQQDMDLGMDRILCVGLFKKPEKLKGENPYFVGNVALLLPVWYYPKLGLHRVDSEMQKEIPEEVMPRLNNFIMKLKGIIEEEMEEAITELEEMEKRIGHDVSFQDVIDEYFSGENYDEEEKEILKDKHIMNISNKIH